MSAYLDLIRLCCSAQNDRDVANLRKFALELGEVQNNIELVHLFKSLSHSDFPSIPDSKTSSILLTRCINESSLHTSYLGQRQALVIFSLRQDEDDPRYRVLLSHETLSSHFSLSSRDKDETDLLHFVPVFDGLDPHVEVREEIIASCDCNRAIHHDNSIIRRQNALRFIVGRFETVEVKNHSDIVMQSKVFVATENPLWLCSSCIQHVLKDGISSRFSIEEELSCV